MIDLSVEEVAISLHLLILENCSNYWNLNKNPGIHVQVTFLK